MTVMEGMRNKAMRVGAVGAVAGAAAATYMAFEAQWPRLRRADLAVPGLPPRWSGVTVLHLSDLHAGLFLTNQLSFEKVIEWALPLEPDLVLLTGDVLGDRSGSARCLEFLARLRPPLGMFAVTGNHEYGLGKGPLAHARDVSDLWQQAGAVLLCDGCAALPSRAGTQLLLCGADYLTGGFGLLEDGHTESGSNGGGHSGSRGCTDGRVFPILLIHEPPSPDSPLAARFPLAFAGHTHGGQLRVPGPRGLTPLVNDEGAYLAGVYRWGEGRLVVSRGVGTSFLPFRLLTRPEATLWRLVCGAA
jgi:predicted MPP superfamily phosphohydrolase